MTTERELVRIIRDGKVVAVYHGSYADFTRSGLHFAWDVYEDRDSVLLKLRMFVEVCNKRPHSHNSIVYVLVNHTSTFEQDLERIYTLREMGYWAYVMIYDKAHCDRKYVRLQRWVNNRFIFSRCKRFEDYNIIEKQDDRQLKLNFE